MPRVLTVDAERPDASVIDEAVKVLRDGGLVGIPTETVYGLAGRALDPAALARIFAAKGRPAAHPLIAHVESADQARALAASWSEAAARLASAFFPGPLTLVVPRGANVPLALTGGGDTVAVRAPAHPVARALIAALGEPLAAPSANRYQTVSPTRASHVVRSLGDQVDLVLDAGATKLGIESTVVDVTQVPPRVLRPGAMRIGKLRAVVPDLVTSEAAVAKEGETRASPGMDARHYAPRAPVAIIDGYDSALRMAHVMATGGKRVFFLCRAGNARAAEVPGLSIQVLGETPDDFEAHLFDALHAADASNSDVIVVESVPGGEDWMAVRDRLRRARA